MSIIIVDDLNIKEEFQGYTDIFWYIMNCAVNTTDYAVLKNNCSLVRWRVEYIS
jgi:hypothetical protein